MRYQFTTYLIALCVAFTGATASFDAKAQNEASALSAISAMPLASVVAAGSAVVALIPNAVGRALLHNRRLTP